MKGLSVDVFSIEKIYNTCYVIVMLMSIYVDNVQR